MNNGNLKAQNSLDRLTGRVVAYRRLERRNLEPD